MCTEVELAMSVDHDDAATDTRGATKGTETYVPEEVPGGDGEGGKQVEGVAEEEPREDSDAIMEGIVTEKRKGNGFCGIWCRGGESGRAGGDGKCRPWQGV